MTTRSRRRELEAKGIDVDQISDVADDSADSDSEAVESDRDPNWK